MLSILKALFTPPHRAAKPDRRFRPRLEVLEERFALASDVWTDTRGDFLWTEDANWSLGHAPQYVANDPNKQDVATFVPPQPGVPNSGSNDNCKVTGNFTILGLGLSQGYGGQLILIGGSLTMVGSANNISAINNTNGVKFTETSDSLTFQNGTESLISTTGFTGAQGSVYINKGSTFTIQNTAASGSTANIHVGTADTNGTLVMSNTAIFHMNSGAYIQVSADGTMNLPLNTVQMGGLTGMDGGSGGAYIDNSGLVTRANAGAAVYAVNIPLINEAGSLLVVNASLLEIGDSNATSNNVSIWQKGGKTNLLGGATLTADEGYLQDGGTLQTGDATQAFLNTSNGGAGGFVTIHGGNVILSANDNTQYGSLKINTTLVFNGGEYDCWVNGDVNGQCDQIEAAAINIVANTSKLVVHLNNTWHGLFGWNILIDDAGPITNKFGQEVFPDNTFESTLGNQTPGTYRVRT